MTPPSRAPLAGLALGGGLLALLSPAPEVAGPAPHPAPTANPLAPDAEDAEQKARRDAWFRQMRRAPPDVDPEAVIRANGRARMARRNALAVAPPSADPDAARWTERGSDNQAGRMHVARVGPDGETVYAGSSLGGLWRGTLDGAGWTPLGDGIYGGVHEVAVFEPDADGDPPVLLVGTGDGLVHVSDDEGTTWVEPEGLGTLAGLRSLERSVDPDGTEHAWIVASAGGAYRVFRSDDDGRTFEEVASTRSFSADLWPARDGRVFLATRDGIAVTEDAGATWTTVAALPATASRAEIAGSDAGGPRLWVVTDGARLYRSDGPWDGDAEPEWEDLGGVSDYWGILGASRTDPDVAAWGGVELWITHDGGDTFRRHNTWDQYYASPADMLHADMMGISTWVDEAGDETWFVGTDGGLYRSTDQLGSFENLSLRGLRVSQYYSVHTSAADPEHVQAGAQDQGYQATAGMEQDDGVWEFEQVLSGDYGHLTTGDDTHELVYSVYPGFILVVGGEDDPTPLAYLEFPAGESYVPWLPPVLADPEDPEAFFFAANHLYRYTRAGRSWTPERWSDQDFEVDRNEYLSALAFSPLDPDRMYAASSSGRFWTSDDHGVTWTEAEDGVPEDNWYYGQVIVPSNRPGKEDVVFVGGAGFGGAAVHRSTDGGRTFEPWGDGLPDTLVYAMAMAEDGSGRLVAGTATSAWRRDPGDAAWREITGAVAPVTTYWDVDCVPGTATFRFGTYGRGIWEYAMEPWEDAGGDTGDPGDDTGVPDGGDTAGDDGGAGDGEAAPGCGCAASPGPGGAAWMLLGLAGLAARRRGARRDDPSPLR